jgi:flavodoxin I
VNHVANAAGGAPELIRRHFLHIVFASTSGHTEYVVDALIKSLKGIAPGWEMEQTMAEKTQPQDLLRGVGTLSKNGSLSYIPLPS